MTYDVMQKAAWLRELNINTVLQKTASAQYPGSPCAFRSVTGIFPMIKNCRSLLIGPEICLYNARISMSRRASARDNGSSNSLLLLISDHDLVFGMSDKIKTAVRDICTSREMDALFIITTCLQEIIGEDFDAVLNELAEETDIPIIGIHTDNFTCDNAEPGLKNTMLAMTKLMKPREVINGSVNIWGLSNRQTEETEIIKLMQSKGVYVNTVFPAPCRISDLENAPAAEYNLVMAQHCLPLAEVMNERFGTKFIYCEKPYTVNENARMYSGIAETLKIDLSAEIREMTGKLEKRIKALHNKLTGKSCVIGMFQGMQTGRYFNLAELLIDMGLEIKGMMLRSLLPQDWEDIDRLKAFGLNFPIIHAGNSLSNNAFLSEVRPDFYIGSGDTELLARFGISQIDARSSLRKFGFSSLSNFIRQFETCSTEDDLVGYKERYIEKWERT